MSLWPAVSARLGHGGQSSADAPAATGRQPGVPASPLDEARVRMLGLRDGTRRLAGLLERPLASYYLVLGCSLLLLAVGLMMVLSTSTAYDLDQGLPAYSMFAKQVLGAVGGLVLMWVAAKAPPKLLRGLAWPLVLLSILGLGLVLVAGNEVDGAKRWLTIAGMQVQPSEFAKLGLVLWGADLLARKEKLGQLRDVKHLLVPLLPVVVLMSMLVMLGNDLGTTSLLVVIFLALLWVIGTPGRIIFGLVALMLLAFAMLIAVHPYELQRITGFLSAQSSSSCVSCYQLTQGKDALGSGGWFGVGLGASAGKWGWVPNSQTDFIFAILGQELGLLGTICVVTLYGVLAYAGLRIARRVEDTFARLAAGSITVWLTAQALINMGAVLGLLPITGVPLPLISAGVSSLIVTMAALGVLMSCARREPGAAGALAGTWPATPQRLLHWLGLDRP